MTAARRPRRGTRVAAGAALGLAVAPALFVAAWPCAYRGRTASAPADGPAIVTETCASFVEVNGAGILWVLALPVLLAALAFAAVARARRAPAVVAATLLLLFSLVTGFSLGLFFLPSSVLALVAAGSSKPLEEPRRIEGAASG